MGKIEKPVVTDLTKIDKEATNHARSFFEGENNGIKLSDKYWKQEMAKKELLRVELEMKLKDMEKFIELNTS